MVVPFAEITTQNHAAVGKQIAAHDFCKWLSRLHSRMCQIKAQCARHSTAIAKGCNAELVHDECNSEFMN